MLVKPYGTLIRALRGFTNRSANREPRWHHRGPELTTGYNPRLVIGNGHSKETLR